MKIEVKINAKVEVSRDVIDEIFTTALEGGSNYWYDISSKATKLIRDAVPREEDQYLSSAIVKAILDHGVEVPINDIEDEDEVLGIISKDNIEERLQKLVDNGGFNLLQQHIDGNGDADSADTIFQYLTMGEVVFA